MVEMRMKRYLKCYFWSLLATVCVTVVSLIPIPELPDMPDVPLIDKWGHFVMYGGLSCAVWFDICRHRLKPGFWTIACLTFVFPIVWGGLMELGQAYLTTFRSGDWWDFVANSVGVVIAVPVGLAMRRVMRIIPCRPKERRGSA